MSQRKGDENDRKGLRLIHQHRWLRARELGLFMWPRQKNPLKPAEFYIRKWKAKNWILERHLPGRAGRAFVLSERGAAHIGESSGKDWGVHEVDAVTGVSEWRPPKKWKHELLQSSLLACLALRGWQFIAEREIRSLGAREDRIPDGVVFLNELRCWLEVESSRKSGKLLTRMVHTLISVATQPETWVFTDFTVNAAMLAFSSEQRDERQYQLNHLSRVAARIQKEAQRDVPLILAIMKVDEDGAVTDVTLDKYVVQFDAASLELAKVEWVTDDQGVRHGFWKAGIEFRLTREENTEEPWYWEVYQTDWDPRGAGGKERFLESGNARTAKDAERAAYEAAIYHVAL